jgi:hypothetical protein
MNGGWHDETYKFLKFLSTDEFSMPATVHITPRDVLQTSVINLAPTLSNFFYKAIYGCKRHVYKIKKNEFWGKYPIFGRSVRKKRSFNIFFRVSNTKTLRYSLDFDKQ